MLFGGSFDPIHFGHLEIAKNVLKNQCQDEVWFVLAALNPFKMDATDFDKRKKMINLMIENIPNMKVCDIEKSLPIPSYSIDTLRALNAQYPQIQFSWLIGSDQIAGLPQWKNFESLEMLTDFYVYHREGYNEKHKYPIIYGKTYNVSSTEIRKGNALDTNPKVLSYMMHEGLYLKSMASNKLSKKRYEHCLRVMELAMTLGEKHQLDLKKVYLMAMMHDIAKEWDSQDLLDLMKAHFVNQVERHPAFYHAYAASYILKHDYHVADIEILDAIENHVDGNVSYDLGKVLFIADKCEKGRPYDTSALVSLAMSDLNEGFEAVKLSSQQFIKENL